MSTGSHEAWAIALVLVTLIVAGAWCADRRERFENAQYEACVKRGDTGCEKRWLEWRERKP